MDIEEFRKLLTPTGQDLLAEVDAGYDPRTAVSLAGRLRRRYPPSLVAAAMTQASLRQAARTKWGEAASRMYLTRDGLEQATTGQVAAYRAARIHTAGVTGSGHTSGVAGGSARGLADLCCGIGGDLLALAAAGFDVTGIDSDPLTVEIARANLAVLGLADRARVEIGAAADHDRSSYAGVIADPSRRSGRGRIFDPSGYSPPWSFVEEVLGGTACVKAAPIIPHRLVPPDAEAEWISVGGEVKEAALWSGALRSSVGASRVRRRATVLPVEAAAQPAEAAGQQVDPGNRQLDGVLAAATLTDADDPGGAGVDRPREYLYEPDGAVIRSGLVTALVPILSGALLHAKIAYLVSDRLVATPFATAYRVDQVLPYDVKAIRRCLRARDVGRLTIKKRGVEMSPEALRKELGVRGPAEATVVVTRSEQGTLALLVEPVRSTAAPGLP